MFGPDYDKDPHAVYDDLRDLWGPVAPVLLEPDVPAWLVLGYNEVLRITRNPWPFTHDSRHWRDLREGRVPEQSATLAAVAHQPNVLCADGPEHERLRKPITDALRQLDQGTTARLVRHQARQLIAKFAASGRAEAVEEYARPLPALVFNRLFGLPEERGWDLAAALAGGRGGPGAGAGSPELTRYLADLVERRRAEPGEDLASWLLAHSSGLTHDELLRTLTLLVTLGAEPTADLLASTIHAMLTDQDSEPNAATTRLVIDDAIDQVLWTEPPVQNCPGRFPTQNVRVGNVDIKAGDAVVLGFAAANTNFIRSLDGSDHDHLEMAGKRAHLAWGAGPHRCPASALARVIAKAGVEALLHRLGDVHLANPEAEPRWRPSPFARGLAELPIVFDPAAVDRTGLPVPDQAHADQAKDRPGRWRLLDRLRRGQ
ncbi:cytochrome P450 [Goodfellowiella coeruleoviolacea]|uniref:Cytochrome P450 n=1 Tax=Goodfellowiella coeruleoviolacea TaxID=334858 RepID=A0AAE3GAZ1_9PSEU|nr:cytochrome P450 [Goodfellowiella coeruleoviolacea]MCP2164951.1 Cytochrome P450 [Goodfellowiella coeruleoviolacea]